MSITAARQRPPRRRAGMTYEFELNGEGHLTVTELADGRPGELFITWAKQGSTLQGLCDALAIAVSLGLQHGVPLADYTRRLTGTRFEPAGCTGDPQLPQATSLVDYISRRLTLDYLPPTGQGAATMPVAAVRQRPSRRRAGMTYELELGGGGHFTVTELADGSPGELFIILAKQGSTLAGLCDALAISVSLGLQHGVPLADYTRRLTGMRFEPAGSTGDPYLPQATSVVDYIFRRLALDYLPRRATRPSNGIPSSSPVTNPEPPAASTLRGSRTMPTLGTSSIMPPLV